MTGALFDWPHAEPAPDQPPAEKLSPDARRTQRQLTTLRRGMHPLAGGRLHRRAAPVDDRQAPGRRCGNCAFRQLVAWHNRTYAKCTWGAHLVDPAEWLHGVPLDLLPRVSHGAATDVRAWWPGCTDHEYGAPEIGPDAARYVPEEIS